MQTGVWPKNDSSEEVEEIGERAQTSIEPLPRLLINLATKKLTFIVKGKKTKIRTWVDANGQSQPSRSLQDSVGGVRGGSSSTDPMANTMTTCRKDVGVGVGVDVGNRNITLRINTPSTIFCRSGAFIRMYSLTESSSAKSQFSSNAETPR
ncbi:unnamed protein product [Soboliphyme baturini]|uniref:MHD domain-containing protein n=1 Tax=Soboliphyme baturini TaxID=241478 RepID=A0A183IW16_9BILA|nr:unnamed protein product [Soboliphyme baturini]